MGINERDHGARRSHAHSAIADALFNKVQQRVLGVLFGNCGRTFFATEIIRIADSGSGAVQRELARLEDAGLVTVEHVGRQKHYQANAAASVFSELRALVLKTSGIGGVIRDALATKGTAVYAAFIYGSIAKGEDTATSDIDLLVITDTLSYAEIFSLLEPASASVGRTVNPTIYSRAELAKRIKGKNAFITRVLHGPKIWVIGGEHDLEPRKPRGSRKGPQQRGP
jgi:predicted nucleotidyltransferase